MFSSCSGVERTRLALVFGESGGRLCCKKKKTSPKQV